MSRVMVGAAVTAAQVTAAAAVATAHRMAAVAAVMAVRAALPAEEVIHPAAGIQAAADIPVEVIQVVADTEATASCRVGCCKPSEGQRQKACPRARLSYFVFVQGQALSRLRPRIRRI